MIRPLLYLFILIACLEQSATAQYIETNDALYVGAPTTLSLPAATDTVHITYRPGSRIATTDSFPVAGATWTWTPREAGVVMISTPEGGAQNVSVRFNQTPWQGVMILLLAGGVLFGGAIVSFRTLFSSRPQRKRT